MTKYDLSKEKKIQKFLSRQKKSPKKSLLKKAFDFCIFPVTLLNDVFSFLLDYDGHLENRIYGRIYDVLKITGRCSNDEENFVVEKNTIKDIISKCSDGHPIGVYDFFEKCGYWDYCRNKKLEEICKKWAVCKNKDNNMEKVDMGYISGYGAILFTDGTDYIYVFKGTDFDSYGRDWLESNLLQGLTGFSGQHYNAIINAKDIDEQVGNKASLWFTGHSLGGGLASAATIATYRREGYTFNAAGLNIIGTTLNKIANNPNGIFFPSSCWNRVHPYRIKGEVLDTLQKTLFRAMTLGFLRRAYGKKVVELKIDTKVDKCTQKHGINNFLYKEVMESLKPYDEVKSIQEEGNCKNKKVVEVIFNGPINDFYFSIC